jgi:fatty-acyl-CoA synthase
MTILPSTHQLPLRTADFQTLTEALDYAAGGETGANFFSGRGRVIESLSYRQLRHDAVRLARKLLGMGLRHNDRVALIAETDAHFLRFFYACLYAGLNPVALPASVKLGAHHAYTEQLRRLLQASEASLAVASEGYLPFLREAGEGLDNVRVASPEELYELPEKPDITLPPIKPEDTAYLQYTSGSTRFPRGVVITHAGAMANLHGIAAHGVQMRPGDRCLSWLPFYHDMGMVGFVLVPMATQITVDYLDTREFAMRPRQWLNLMSENKATIAFSPSFGYDLCARRLREGEAGKYDLSNWRVAGIGAEMIRPETLDYFASELKPAGFDPRAFLPCYGMAECTLGVSFSPLGKGYSTDYIDSEHLAECDEVLIKQLHSVSGRGRHFVNCGKPLPGHEVEIRDDDGQPLGDCKAGIIHVRGPSVMKGYFNAPDETASVLSSDGWLNTGDIGYMNDGVLTITGRKKDMIIIRGRNIWPQDLEYIAESQPEIRVGDAVAFSAPNEENEESCVLMIQTRERAESRRLALIKQVKALVQRELNLECSVALVPPRSLPRTSSGKLSRARARQNYIASLREHKDQEVAFEEPRRVASSWADNRCRL